MSSATTWAKQLASAGVNLNLAPVADTVPSAAFAPSNAPIGAKQRQFGYTPSTVSSHASAFTKGMRAGGVMVSAKHFPGLGRVTGNTDTTSGVTDRTTTRTDSYLTPFKASAKPAPSSSCCPRRSTPGSTRTTRPSSPRR